jgi:hypothetical protein
MGSIYRDCNPKKTEDSPVKLDIFPGKHTIYGTPTITFIPGTNLDQPYVFKSGEENSDETIEGHSAIIYAPVFVLNIQYPSEQAIILNARVPGGRVGVLVLSAVHESMASITNQFLHTLCSHNRDWVQTGLFFHRSRAINDIQKQLLAQCGLVEIFTTAYNWQEDSFHLRATGS